MICPSDQQKHDQYPKTSPNTLGKREKTDDANAATTDVSVQRIVSRSALTGRNDKKMNKKMVKKYFLKHFLKHFLNISRRRRSLYIFAPIVTHRHLLVNNSKILLL